MGPEPEDVLLDKQAVAPSSTATATAVSNYDQAGTISRLFLTWMSPVIDLSSQKPLELEDLGAISTHFSSSNLSGQFMNLGHFSRENQLSSVSKLLSSLFGAFGTEFMVSGILKFLGDCVSLTSPIILKMLLQLIKVKSDSPGSPALHDWKMAMLLAVTIFALQSANSMSVNLYFQRTFQCGFKVRVSLTSFIYQKALKLSLQARKEFNPSKIVNLVSVDCSRIDRAISFLHYIWSGPFQTLTIVAMLYKLVGWSAFIGLLLFILFFPVQGKIVGAISEQRKRTSQFTDQRLRLMAELVSGIKIIKTHAWEEEVMKRVLDIRAAEMRNVKKIQNLQAAMSTIMWIVPVFACIGTFLVYRHINGELPIDRVLPALAYFNLLRTPLILLPVVVGFAIDARVSLMRIAELFSAEEKEDYVTDMSSDSTILDISDSEFVWNKDQTSASAAEEQFKLTVDKLEISKGELVCIVGPIGSGKSSLIQAILGEMYLIKGRIGLNKQQKIAVCHQQAWILTGTIRDNILFGLDFDPELYGRVLDVCQLRSDLELFPAGDMTIIGERGTNLSGGQKQRLSIARAVYSQSDIYILDDPLSALDARVANAVWEECICGMLKDTTRVIVTHSHRHIVNNRTIEMRSGRIESDHKAVKSTISQLEKKDLIRSQSPSGKSSAAKKEERVDEEDRAVGDISKKVFYKYAQYFGGPLFILAVAFALILNHSVRVASDIWLSSEETMTSVTEEQFALVYCLSGVLQGILIFVVSVLFNAGALSAAKLCHDSALSGLLRSSLLFFEKTFSGRILNRFSRDVDAADNQLSESWRTVSITAIGVLATLVLTFVLAWPSIITIIPVMYLFFRVQMRFRPPARELKRLDALTKAPVFSHVSESLNGILTVRSYKSEDRFISVLFYAIDRNGIPVFLSLSLQRWVTVRLEMIGNFIILSAAMFAYATANWFAFTGLSVVYALNTTAALNWLIRSIAETESQMISCERLMHYADDLPSESDLGQKEVPVDWPHPGEVQITNLSISYRLDRPPALLNFNLSIRPGEHVGIAGRTGAGKSTIISAFFRLYNVASIGSIVIDGVDIQNIPLKTLRRRLAIIPQDPVLFSGTIRSNLDPFGQYLDGDLWLALERSGLARVIKKNSAGLDGIVDAQGENWSAGERQLLCLARALLAKAKIILLDEATSSVDPATDASIQECIAKDLASSTVLIVAHRLNTIMHCSRVIVLDAGEIIEQGPPKELALRDGPFGTLLKQQHYENH